MKIPFIVIFAVLCAASLATKPLYNLNINNADCDCSNAQNHLYIAQNDQHVLEKLIQDTIPRANSFLERAQDVYDKYCLTSSAIGNILLQGRDKSKMSSTSKKLHTLSKDLQRIPKANTKEENFLIDNLQDMTSVLAQIESSRSPQACQEAKAHIDAHEAYVRSVHDALDYKLPARIQAIKALIQNCRSVPDRKSTRLNSSH